MKSIKRLLVMKCLASGMLSLFVIMLLAACGGPDQAMAAVQNSQSQQAMLSAPKALSSSVYGSYPDPGKQDGLPESVKVSGAGEMVILRAVVAEGHQIYECQASTSGFAWKLQAPFAFLKADDGNNVIHSTGPAWLYTKDGSEIIAVVGKFTDATGASVPASATPDAKSVAWLRLDVTEHKGNDGLFHNVDQIQRLYTKGGVAPTSGCNQDVANHHVILPVSYTAEYVFWGHKA